MISVKIYSGFAYLYDVLMESTPYKDWAAYIDRVLKQFLQKSNAIVLDLACGTGSITLPLAQMGYDMIGVDMSIDMLSQAQAKVTNEKILFLAQDMRKLDLYGTVDAAISTCDGLNYILDETELASVFKRVMMFMNPQGVFIFDMNTEYKFKEVLGNKGFTVKKDTASYDWDNSYDAKTGINEYRVTFEHMGGEPFCELHHQRAYPSEMICDFLRNAGFETVRMYDGYSDDSPNEKSVRIVYIAS